MAKLAMLFGFLLIILGVSGFVYTGSEHSTALIPVWFGLLLDLAGALAKSKDEKKRMLWMHVAVTVGLLGFIGSAAMVAVAYAKAHGGELARPVATAEQMVMALLCGVFVGLCVRSFIAARKARST